MVSDDLKKRVIALWNNPKVGLTGLSRFQQKCRAEGIHLTTDELKEILVTNAAHALFTYYPRAKKWNTITEAAVGRGMQMDLLDMKALATRNKNYAWILCIIHVYSRYAWAFALRRKSQRAVYAVLKAWLESLSIPPRRMTSDAGTEFTSKTVQRLMKTYGTVQYFNQVGDKTTTGIVEQFNRTLRELIGRNFARVGKLHWIHDLEGIVKNYNHSVHRTLGATPDDVWNHNALPKTRDSVRETFILKEGDPVRLWLPQGMFDKKAGAQRWSSELYAVVRRQGFKYIVKNAQGEELSTRYRPSHLKKVDPLELSQMSNTLADSVAAGQRRAHRAQRLRHMLRRQDMRPTQVLRNRLRASTLRKRLRVK